MPDNQREELIVACHTEGDYARVAETYLLPSLKALGLKHDVRKYRSRGSWVENGFACQDFLRTVCLERPEAHVLFLDVDAVVRSDPWPLLRGLECDLAGHYFRGRELLTGTLYLPVGPRRLEIINRWVERNYHHSHKWDQINLQEMIETDKTIRFVDLPAEYCFIFDLQRKHTPAMVPVIEHFQVSRRFRKAV